MSPSQHPQLLALLELSKFSGTLVGSRDTGAPKPRALVSLAETLEYQWAAGGVSPLPTGESRGQGYLHSGHNGQEGSSHMSRQKRYVPTSDILSSSVYRLLVKPPAEKFISEQCICHGVWIPMDLAGLVNLHVYHKHLWTYASAGETYRSLCILESSYSSPIHYLV